MTRETPKGFGVVLIEALRKPQTGGGFRELAGLFDVIKDGENWLAGPGEKIRPAAPRKAVFAPLGRSGFWRGAGLGEQGYIYATGSSLTGPRITDRLEAGFTGAFCASTRPPLDGGGPPPRRWHDEGSNAKKKSRLANFVDLTRLLPPWVAVGLRGFWR